MSALEPRQTQLPDGRPLPYHVAGEGRPMVLVNAYGMKLAFLEPLAAALAEHGHRIIALECRGLAEPLEAIPGPAEHAGDVARILDAEGIERAHLVGWCTGPKVALELEHAHPGRVRSMTFVTGSFSPLAGAEELVTAYDVNIAKVARVVDRRPHLAGLFLKSLSGALSATGEAEPGAAAPLGVAPQRYHDLILEPLLSEEAIRAYTRMVVRFKDHSVEHLLGEVRAPTLFIGAEHDVIAHPGISAAAAARVPGAHHVELAGGTHWCLLEDVDRLCYLIERQAFVTDFPEAASCE